MLYYLKFLIPYEALITTTFFYAAFICIAFLVLMAGSGIVNIAGGCTDYANTCFKYRNKKLLGTIGIVGGLLGFSIGCAVCYLGLWAIFIICLQLTNSATGIKEFLFTIVTVTLFIPYAIHKHRWPD